MTGFLLLGPVSCDTIIKGSKKTHSIGGPVYYQSRVFSGLGVEHTAAVTLAKNDQEMLSYFPDKTEVIPLFKKETVKFENKYIFEDPNQRVQRSNAPEIPVTLEDISKIFSGNNSANESRWHGVCLGPLLPEDIPLETVVALKNKGLNIYLGAQGYLRQFDGCDIHLKPGSDFKKFLKFVKIVFLDKKEALSFNKSSNSSLEDIAKNLTSYGPEEVVITCGNKGSLVYSKKTNKSYKISAFPPKDLRDPTGLGDTYMAAYLSKKSFCDDPLECGRFAAMAATIKLENKEGFTQSEEYVKKRLNQVK